MGHHHHISVTIITFNEQNRIEECLKSVSEIADEIVVVDSNSTDNTVEICRRYGAKVTSRQFSGYGWQRQFATSLATHTYVLSVDADEVLSPALIKSIKRIKEEGFQHRVYEMTRLNFYCGLPVRHCGWYPDRQIRLFDKRYAHWTRREVRESVELPEGLNPYLLDGDILHYRCNTPQEYLAVELRHAALNSARLVRNNSNISVLTPFLEGVRAFFNMFVSNGGMLDGNVGRNISIAAYKSAYTSYNLARRTRLKLLKNS
ncbi:MAG: glycosyltransferase family 2 protein [Muribaculum sp.]|nr:glycosyltransferase family 2 protein [Muribaculum sp.]